MPLSQNIEHVDARFSELWIIDKKFVIKKMKNKPVWEKGGKRVTTAKGRIENALSAYKEMPDFFPEIISLSGDMYIREYFNAKSLYEEPEQLESAIGRLRKFCLASMNRDEVKNGAKKIPFYGKLWKIGISRFPELVTNKNDYKITPVYILGDAKPENILIHNEYLSYDTESFCIGDISSDLELIVEHYQFFKQEKLLERTLECTKKTFTDIDGKIIEKILLGLIAMKWMELGNCKSDSCRKERTHLLEDAINLFKKYKA